MPNILIVEDDMRIAKSLAQELRPFYTNVFLAYTYDMGKDAAMSDAPDIICVDINLGEKRTGLDLCKEIREEKPFLPMLIITSMAIHDTIEPALDLGISDYISKPYHPDEVRIRVNNLLSLSEQITSRRKQPLYAIASDFEIDFAQSIVRIDGEEKHLSRILRQLLQLFVNNPNEILSHKFLHEKIWGDYYSMNNRREIRSHTKRLRALLGEKYGSCIQNVKSQGYIFRI